MKIADRIIGPQHPPYIIAEVSCNHNGYIENALELIKAARYAGADAVKFQAYTPDTMTLDCIKPDFIIQGGIWKGQTLYDLYNKTYTPFDWFPKLFALAAKEGITAFASVFDKSAVDMLEAIDCPAYKIASMEITDTPLIAHAASKGKPLIISTGMAKLTEVMDARQAAGPNSAFLHCTSEYPGTVELADLSGIRRLRNYLNDTFVEPAVVGVSDHTGDSPIVPVAATALGACIIEKHIMLDMSETEDREFSLTPKEFKWMVTSVRSAYEAIQARDFACNPSLQFRRSLYAVEDIRCGEKITDHNIRSIRPGYGIAPKHLPRLIGKTATQNYRKGDRIT
jgi:pseudaminic acid synthase